MIRTLLPAAVGLIAILSLSFYEGYHMKDRWGEPGAEAALLGERFAQVPLNIAGWEGEDLPVDEVVRETAGAVNYVSRRYTHSTTGKKVVLWLIVGHSRDIVRHTPNACYPSAGFRQVGSTLLQDFEYKGDKEAKFFTAKFEKEDAFSKHTERVFWAWNHPDENEWDAPTVADGGARFKYGLAKVLYKLYFTSTVLADEDEIADSAAYDFAEVMLPAIDAALFPTNGSTLPASEPMTDQSGEPSAPLSQDAIDEPMDDFRRVIEINLNACFLLSKLVAAPMRDQQWGSIINIASVHGIVGSAPNNQAAYSASKAGLINLTRELALQWVRHGIRVNAIAPGYFETELTEQMIAAESGAKWINRNTPMRRPGTLGELDGTTLLLASDAGSYITGQTVAVDGGWTAR